MLLLSRLSESQIFYRCLPRFLYETVRQHHTPSGINIEQHASDTIVLEIAPHLIETATHGPANRHADRPPELHRSDVCTDSLPVLAIR